MDDTKKEKLRGQLHKILDMVIDTNGFDKRQRISTGTLPSIWFDFSGHINSLQIRLATDGYVPYAGNDREWDFSLDNVISDESIEDIRSQFEYALSGKKESDVLERDIQKEENNLANQKSKVNTMKHKLRKLQKEGR